jgi:hypothetical protein
MEQVTHQDTVRNARQILIAADADPEGKAEADADIGVDADSVLCRALCCAKWPTSFAPGLAWPWGGEESATSRLGGWLAAGLIT